MNIKIDYLPYQISAPDANDNSISINLVQKYQQEYPYVIEVIAGSFQFCHGQAVGPNSPVYAAGAKIVITGLNETPVYFKAGSVNDQFIIGY